MKLRILYQAQYAYTEAVSFSEHIFRLIPKQDRYVSILQLDFQTNLGARVSYRRDLFDNEVALCFYPEKSALLASNLSILLDVRERRAFDFSIDYRAKTLPFAYSPEEALALAPYLGGGGPVALPFWQPPAGSPPTDTTLTDLNRALHEHLGYERREEGAARPAAETIQLGSGSCRDFSVLLAEVARGLGLASRLASGYLCEFGDGDKVAEGALHAWTEIYLPGPGWLGFDPTNGTLCDHHHLTAAVGLTPRDITPVLGTFYHPTSLPPATMNASLQILPHADS